MKMIEIQWELGLNEKCIQILEHFIVPSVMDEIYLFEYMGMIKKNWGQSLVQLLIID